MASYFRCIYSLKVIIVAPSDNIRIMSDITESTPEWKMYLNGKLVNSFDGTTRPFFSDPETLENQRNC